MSIILGSQSPRRKEILSYFNLPFQQVSPPFDESSIPFQGQPEEYVCSLSKGKAQSLKDKFPASIIITADTIVFYQGKIYGKPQNEQEAFNFLSELVGKWHEVYTGVSVQKGNEVYSQAEVTRVLFNPLTSNQIKLYLDKTHWGDKAGGYAIQESGGLIVEKIDGCYYNVMGLPINTVEKLLKNVNIELWDFF